MKVRPLHLRRSWLFVGATNENDIKHSYKSEADVCILEFEDFEDTANPAFLTVPLDFVVFISSRESLAPAPRTLK